MKAAVRRPKPIPDTDPPPGGRSPLVPRPGPPRAERTRACRLPWASVAWSEVRARMGPRPDCQRSSDIIAISGRGVLQIRGGPRGRLLARAARGWTVPRTWGREVAAGGPIVVRWGGG